jgi:hypothetical protein
MEFKNNISLAELKQKIIGAVISTGNIMKNGQLTIVDRGMPHCPSGLESGMMGVYAFIYNGQYLKVGKANSNSSIRFKNHHYNPNSSNSNLAKSILKDPDMKQLKISVENIKNWIKTNTYRIDFILDENLGFFVLNFVEAYLQLIFKPKYEGFKSQSR